jgi:hypothetical protein
VNLRRFDVLMSAKVLHRIGCLSIISTVSAILGFVSSTAAAQALVVPEPVPWLDVSGEPLPFQNDAEIEKALLAADVKNQSATKHEGLAGYEMLLLEHDGAQFYALFRSNERGGNLDIAAYILNRLIGLEDVPPVVGRAVEGTQGAVQIWRGHAGTELELEETGRMIPPNPKDFKHQRQSMMLFDKLIANPDRSPETVLIDPGWRVWLVAHAEAFRSTSEVADLIELTKCERSVWQEFKELDKTSLRESMGPYLEKKELNQLISRHRKLVRHIHDMISTYGEEYVLF